MCKFADPHRIKNSSTHGGRTTVSIVDKESDVTLNSVQKVFFSSYFDPYRNILCYSTDNQTLSSSHSHHIFSAFRLTIKALLYPTPFKIFFTSIEASPFNSMALFAAIEGLVPAYFKSTPDAKMQTEPLFSKHSMTAFRTLRSRPIDLAKMQKWIDSGRMYLPP